MTGRTTGQHLGRLNVIALRQRRTQFYFFLGFVFSAPFHVENMFLLSHKPLGSAMTLQTPFHLQ